MWPPIRTARSDSPRSVHQWFPASSTLVLERQPSSLPRSQARACAHVVGPGDALRAVLVAGQLAQLTQLVTVLAGSSGTPRHDHASKACHAGDECGTTRRWRRPRSEARMVRADGARGPRRDRGRGRGPPPRAGRASPDRDSAGRPRRTRGPARGSARRRRLVLYGSGCAVRLVLLPSLKQTEDLERLRAAWRRLAGPRPGRTLSRDRTDSSSRAAVSSCARCPAARRRGGRTTC